MYCKVTQSVVCAHACRLGGRGGAWLMGDWGSTRLALTGLIALVSLVNEESNGEEGEGG